MKRRQFIAGLGGAVAWPLTARAQQAALPVIGLLAPFALSNVWRPRLAAMHRGLAETGYIEGRNVLIEYRSAEDHNDRLPALAADLVRRNVAVIVSFANTPTAVAAKNSTNRIPIVFSIGADPVEYGLVASLARPGGNLTGVTALTKELMPKRMEVLREFVPSAASIAYLFNPANFAAEVDDVKMAAPLLGLRLIMIEASRQDDIEPAFDRMAQQRPDALVVSSDTFFSSYYDEIGALAIRHRIPSMFAVREAVALGGLISYGANGLDSARQVGIYAGRVLRGEKPADLPVQQPTKFEMGINLRTAKTLGLTVPPSLLATADEVID